MSEMLQGYTEIILGLWGGIKRIFNIPNYIAIFKQYSPNFTVTGWILAVLAIVLVAAIYLLLVFLIILAVRKYIRFRHSIVSNEDLLEEIAQLQRQVLKMAKEKDEIMAMKISQMGPAAAAVMNAGSGEALEGDVVVDLRHHLIELARVNSVGAHGRFPSPACF